MHAVFWPAGRVEPTEEQYERIKDALPRQRGNVSIDNRTRLNALFVCAGKRLQVARRAQGVRPLAHGVPAARTLEQGRRHRTVFARLQAEQILAVRIEAVGLDSTSIKVHPDGTGARKKTGRKPLVVPVAAGRPRFIWSPRLTGVF